MGAGLLARKTGYVQLVGTRTLKSAPIPLFHHEGDVAMSVPLTLVYPLLF